MYVLLADRDLICRVRMCVRENWGSTEDVLGPLPDTKSYRDSQLHSIREYIAAIATE